MSEPLDPQPEEPSGAIVPAGERSLASASGGLAARGLVLATDLLSRVGRSGPPGEICCLTGHRDCVMSVAFAPNGQQVASASWDGTVRVWEVHSGRELLCIQRHSGRVSSVAFSTDGERLITASWDGTVRMWESNTGRELMRFGSEGAGMLHCAAVSPDRYTLAWGGAAAEITVVDLTTGVERYRCPVPVGPVRCLKFSPDGRTLVSGSGQVAVLGGGRDNGSICSWHVETGNRIWGRVDATEPVLSVDFSADGGLLFSSTGWPARSRLNVTVLWDAATGEEICRYTAHRQPIFAGVFAGAARRLLLGGRDRVLRLWDAALEQEVHRFEGHEDTVFGVALSPDGKLAATGSGDRTVRLWRLPDEEI